MRILVQYRTNQDYYDYDCNIFYADYVFDLDRLKAFVAQVTDDMMVYADDEAKRIIQHAETRSPYDLEEHDKYTFYDTDWERDQVLSDDQTSPADYKITVYLNS